MSQRTVSHRETVAAKDLNERRERWVNPLEWIEPIAQRIDAADDFSDVPKEARPLIRQSAIMAAAAPPGPIFAYSVTPAPPVAELPEIVLATISTVPPALNPPPDPIPPVAAS